MDARRPGDIVSPRCGRITFVARPDAAVPSAKAADRERPLETLVRVREAPLIPEDQPQVHGGAGLGHLVPAGSSDPERAAVGRLGLCQVTASPVGDAGGCGARLHLQPASVEGLPTRLCGPSRSACPLPTAATGVA